MYNILVSDKMSQEGLAPLLGKDNIVLDQRHISEVEDLSKYDALLVRSGTKVTADVFAKMPNLKIVARAGVGVDNIDIEAATQHGVIVINAPDGNTISTAEHTFSMMCSLLRNIPQATASVKAGEWNRSKFQGAELFGKTLGIVGMGRIGSQIAKRANAFEMTILAFDPFLTKERAEAMNVQLCSLDEILEQADIITVHTPLTKETKGLIGKHNIGKTKKGVYLLNCARGGIIDESALVEYLDNGHIGGVALDVYEEEPANNTALLSNEKVICTPHIAASTKEAQLNVAVSVAKEVLDYFNGKPATHSLNLPAMSAETYQKIQPYYDLTKMMGNIISQLVKVPVYEIKVEYSGEIGKLETTITTRALLAGFFQTRVDGGVNEVNAAIIAEQRGITFGEKVRNEDSGYANLVSATVIGEDTNFTIKGTYIKDFGPRIVSVYGFDVDFYPNRNLLYIRHTDRPGMIGRVGQILGESNVNIATMQVGRKEIGGEAIMILTYDGHVTDETIEKLNEIDAIARVRVIEL